MQRHSVKAQDLSGLEDSKVIEILVSVGEEVAVDQSIVTLESDKASMEIPSTVEGKVVAVNVALGDTITQDTVFIEVENDQVEAEASQATPEEAVKAPQTSGVQADLQPHTQPATAQTTAPALSAQPVASVAPATPATPSSATPISNKPSYGSKYHASPAVRQMANHLGADLTQVVGTGIKGRITKEDVQQWIKTQLQSVAQTTTTTGTSAIPTVKVPDFTEFGDITTEPLPRIKKISGNHLSSCWLNAPHVTQFDEVFIDELEDFRKQQNQLLAKVAKDEKPIKLTPLAFFVKAVATALKQHQMFNASLDKESIILKHYYNIGVAVDTPNGLVVPVIKGVDQKGVLQIAEDLTTLSGKARAGKLTPADMSGGCFTISSLGGIGGTHFTPIINLPEVAIMGIGKASIQPRWNGSEFVPGLKMPVSLSYDHRVVDGAQGAHFMVTFNNYLSDLKTLLL